MSKKKQLTGKKTKLAKLPLTRALSQNLNTDESWEPAVVLTASPEAEPLQMSLSWEQLEEGAQGLLAAAYTLILKDLLSLQALVGNGPGEQAPPLAGGAPALPLVKQALRHIKEDLGELAHILAS